MTKREIKSILKSSLQDGSITFKDSTDKGFLLDILKNDTLEDFFYYAEDIEMLSGADIVEDMQQEFDNLSD